MGLTLTQNAKSKKAGLHFIFELTLRDLGLVDWAWISGLRLILRLVN